MDKKLLAELQKRTGAKHFRLEDYCFDKQLDFIKDPARFKTAVCSRRCLAAGTLVQTTLGPKKIEDITTEDWVYDENGLPIKVKTVYNNGVQEVFEITHNTKVLAKTTKNHVFLTYHHRAGGIKERPVSDIYDGVKIVRNEVHRNSGAHVKYAYALGALLGDGCSREGGKSYISISSENDLIPNAVGAQLNCTEIRKCHPKNYTYNLYADSFPEEYFQWCHNRYAHEKTVDVQRVLSWDRQSRLAFVAGLLDTDGSVCNLKDGLQIDVSMQAKTVIEALQVLFLDLWQFAPSILVDNRPKYKNGPVYVLRLKHNYFGKKILKELTPFLQTSRKKYKEEYANKKENNYNANYVGIKIGKASFEQTYDIHVESATNLYMLANGLITHNSGKTISCAADLMHTAQTTKGDVAYITLNRITAKRIIWRELLTINKNFNIGAKPDNSELTLTLPNGNMIYVSGAKDESEIEKFRGLSLRKVYIDEVQSFRSYISALVEDVIEPALTDYYGTLCLIGTPGPVPAGYFYEASHNPTWAHHHWTMQQNPHIKLKSGKDPLEIIQELATRRGLTMADPSIQREFFGQWIRDLDALVFKFDPIRNTVLTVPEKLNYIMGIDIGWKDADAIAVLGFDYYSKNVYLVEEFIKNKMDITELVENIKRLQDKYGPQKIVMDAGALGKKIQEEIRQRHSIHAEAAEKQRKMEFIKLLNDDLATGKLKALPNSRFAEDCNLVVWDYDNPMHPKISDTYHSDITDAVLYAWRECQHYLSEAPKKGPLLYSEEWAAAEEQRLMDQFDRAQREQTDIQGSQSDIESLFRDD